MQFPLLLGLVGIVAQADVSNYCTLEEIFVDGEVDRFPMNTTMPYFLQGGHYYVSTVKDPNNQVMVVESIYECNTIICDTSTDNGFKLEFFDLGNFMATNGTFSCLVAFGPFEKGGIIGVSLDLVNFYNDAIQIAHGTLPVDEYYVDLDNRPIRLLPDSAVDKPANQNWVVAATGEAAHLDAEPTDAQKNPNYKPATLGRMVTREDWEDMSRYYSEKTIADTLLTSAEMIWAPNRDQYISRPSVQFPVGSVPMYKFAQTANLSLEFEVGQAYDVAAAVAAFDFFEMPVNPPVGPPTFPTPSVGPTRYPLHVTLPPVGGSTTFAASAVFALFTLLL